MSDSKRSDPKRSAERARDSPSAKSPPRKGPGRARILVLSVLFGCGYWVVDGFLHSHFHPEEGSALTAILLHPSFDEAIERLVFLAACLAVGLVYSASLRRKREKERILADVEREREHVARHKAVAETAADFVMELDRDGTVRFASRVLPGYRRDQLVGTSVRNWVFHKYESIVENALEDAFERRTVSEFEMPGTRANCEVGWFACRMGPILVEGRAVGAVLSFVDVTERRRTAEALETETAHATKYFEVAAVVMVVLDREGCVTRINRKGCETLGYPARDIVGKNWFETFLPVRYRDEVRSVFAKVVAGELDRVEYHENPVLTKDGRERIVAWHNVFFEDELGRISGSLSSGEDITERRKAEVALRDFNREMKRQVEQRTAELTVANEELEAFAHSVSHDLRGPLRAIEGFALALSEDCTEMLDDTGRGYLDRIQANCRSMTLLIDDLLDLSRVTCSEVRYETVDLSKMVRTIADGLSRLEPDRQVSFVIAPDVVAVGDLPLLRIAMTNLMINAWKFTSRHPAARIEFGVEESRDERMYFIKDDGAGLNMEHADRLFRAFQRLHAPHEFPGTGIGLTTVHRIVKRHGGRIWVDAAVEKGATFSFTLGAALSADSPPAEVEGS
ncbi:PAS domain S-box protein [Candidatus Sumerlaeota bacterium]|nr:PAS domain S-box protein [Candidatus Sumerlaeota bacterium]